MTPKSKFKAGDVIYFKSPSRYSRSRAPGTIEIILKIIEVAGLDRFCTDDITEYYYIVSIVKTISSKPVHWSTYTNPEPFGIGSLEIETHARRLTAAETVLYG
jgi:hypothetical protein